MNTFHASTAEDWRAWLARNCRSQTEVWRVIHHSASGRPGPAVSPGHRARAVLRLDRQPRA
jgi:hypothetical protein